MQKSMTPPKVGQQNLNVPKMLAMAKAHGRKGELGQAKALYLAVITEFPKNLSAIKGLSTLAQAPKTPKREPLTQPQFNTLVQLFGQGRFEDTVKLASQLIRQNPANAALPNILGSALMQLGKPDDGMQHLKVATLLDPKYAEAFSNLGRGCIEEKKYAASEGAFRQAISLGQKNVPNYIGLSKALEQQDKNEDAKVWLNKALDIEPDNMEAQVGLGRVKFELGDIKAALELFQSTHAKNPDNLSLTRQYSTNLWTAGFMEEAKQLINTAMKKSPDAPELLTTYAQQTKFKADDPMFTKLVNSYENTPETNEMKAVLGFALGKAQEDLGHPEKAFECYARANALTKATIEDDFDVELNRARLQTSLFDGGNVTKSTASSPKKLIFIVGMPRSGTTLTEQILSSHSQVFGAGELGTISHALTPVLDQLSESNRAKFSLSHVNKIRAAYLKKIESLDVDEPVIVDKMPANFRWVGPIKLAFPDAHIVNMNRDPRAVCWSIFKIRFKNPQGHPYSFDQRTLGRYHNLYLKYMELWYKTFGDEILRFKYETLTENQKEQTERLLAFCDLPWEDQCLSFQDNKRVVQTASTAQVRKGMYKGSSAAWQKFETQLQPLIDELTAGGSLPY